MVSKRQVGAISGNALTPERRGRKSLRSGLRMVQHSEVVETVKQLGFNGRPGRAGGFYKSRLHARRGISVVGPNADEDRN